jgi:hypothetical protein
MDVKLGVPSQGNNRFSVFENRILRGLFGTAIGEERRGENCVGEELHNFCSS